MQKTEKDHRMFGVRLASHLGATSLLTKQAVRLLWEGFQTLKTGVQQKTLQGWHPFPAGIPPSQNPMRFSDHLWTRSYGLSIPSGREAELLLAVQSYFALIVQLAARVCLEGKRECWEEPFPQTPPLEMDEWMALEAGQTRTGRVLGLDSPNPFGWYVHAPTRWRRDFLAGILAPIHTTVESTVREWILAWSKGPDRSKAVERPKGRQVVDEVKRRDTESGPQGEESTEWIESLFRDHWKHLYEALLPRSVRHQWGEYATPDGLARYLLTLVGYQGVGSGRLLDPACGSGSFLMAALHATWKAGAQAADDPRDGSRALQGGQGVYTGSPPFLPRRQKSTFKRSGDFVQGILRRIVGWDRNPLAVLAARANWLLALLPWLDPSEEIRIPVFVQDALFQESYARAEPTEQEPFDFVVGNPPWIVWDHLGSEYRDATRPLWRHYGLFSLSGTEGRHGGAKKDLASLITYVAADRYLKPGGRLGVLVPNSLLQTHGAGDGFRRFSLPGNVPLEVVRVEDFSQLRLFGATSQRTAALVLCKGRSTVYPVPYVRWSPTLESQDHWRASDPDLTLPGPVLGPDVKSVRVDIGSKGPFLRMPGENRPDLETVGPVQGEIFWAEPIDPTQPSSPWLVRPAGGEIAWQGWVGPSEYRAYLGANTGGANEIFWFDLVGVEGPRVRVRNGCSASRLPGPAVETLLEPDLLFPLLRWRDVGRWRAVPSCWILLVQDVERRCGIAPEWLESHCPATWDYLHLWKNRLLRRAAYQRYQAHKPFYSLYNVGPYTLSPFKVVWRRMDRQIRASVVGPVEQIALGFRPVGPQETCSFIPTESAEEAYYLAALLNSSPVNGLVQAVGLRGAKGFGSPGMLRWIRLPRFEPTNAQHQELAELAQAAHARIDQGETSSDLEVQIDALMAELPKGPHLD